MVPTALSATMSQYRRGALRASWLRLLVPGAALGAAIGSQVASALSGVWIAALFAIYTGYFALKMLRDRPLKPVTLGPVGRGVDRLPGTTVALLIGGFSSIAGVGGSSLTVPFLLSRGLDMKQAVAVSSAVGLTIAIFGSAGFAAPAILASSTESLGQFGLVCWPAAVLLGATAVLMAPRGVAAGHAMPVQSLKRAFGAVLAVVCATTLLKVIVQPTVLEAARRSLVHAEESWLRMDASYAVDGSRFAL
jgi:uncharacterized membrane protein YfcA